MSMKFVIARPTCGLGNRLRNMACAYALHKMVGGDMFICWERSGDCDVEWSSLVDENKFPLKNIRISDVLDMYPRCNPWHDPTTHTDHVLQTICGGAYDSIIVEGGHDFKHPDMPVSKLLGYKHEFYTMIKDNLSEKTKGMLRAVDDIRFPRIGVHMREHIPFFDLQDKLFFEKDTIVESTIAYMKGFVNQGMKRFFLSTSSDEYVDKIKKEFADTEDVEISTLNQDLDKRSRSDTSICASLVDMVVLSRCSYIVGSYMSSFSDEAALMGNVVKICSTAFDHKKEPYHMYGFYVSQDGLQCINPNAKHKP